MNKVCNRWDLALDTEHTDEQEQEATRFAIELLMPEENFRISFKEFKGDLNKLSDKYGTSLIMTAMRAKELGCRAGFEPLKN